MAEPHTVIPEVQSELVINEADGEIELAYLGPAGLRWLHKIPEKRFTDALERFLDRRKKAGTAEK